MMKQIVMLLIGLAVAVEAAPPVSPFGDKSERILIRTTTAWDLTVRRDGSGMIGNAASAELSYASFPEGTFDFTNVASFVTHFMPTGKTETITVDVIKFEAGQTEAKWSHANLDKNAVISLYTRGFENAKLDGTAVERLWKRWPPFSRNEPSNPTR